MELLKDGLLDSYITAENIQRLSVIEQVRLYSLGVDDVSLYNEPHVIPCYIECYHSFRAGKKTLSSVYDAFTKFFHGYFYQKQIDTFALSKKNFCRTHLRRLTAALKNLGQKELQLLVSQLNQYLSNKKNPLVIAELRKLEKIKTLCDEDPLSLEIIKKIDEVTLREGIQLQKLNTLRLSLLLESEPYPLESLKEEHLLEMRSVLQKLEGGSGSSEAGSALLQQILNESMQIKQLEKQQEDSINFVLLLLACFVEGNKIPLREFESSRILQGLIFSLAKKLRYLDLRGMRGSSIETVLEMAKETVETLIVENPLILSELQGDQILPRCQKLSFIERLAYATSQRLPTSCKLEKLKLPTIHEEPEDD